MRPPEFILFLDENHCNNHSILALCKERRISYKRFLDHFPRGMPDADWLPIVGGQSWCLLTTDKRIRYRALEKHTVREHQVRMFCFSTNQMSGREMADALRVALPRMESLFRNQQPPFIAMITKNGAVYTKEDFSNSAP